MCDAIDSNTPNSIVRSARIEASIDRIFGDIFCTPNTKCTTHHCGRRRRTASASCPSSEQSGGEERPAEATVEEMAQISFLCHCLSNSLFPSLPPSLSLRRRFQPPSNPLSLFLVFSMPLLLPLFLPLSLSLSLSLRFDCESVPFLVCIREPYMPIKGNIHSAILSLSKRPLNSRRIPKFGQKIH